MHDSCAPGPDLMGILLAASKVGLDGDDDCLSSPAEAGTISHGTISINHNEARLHSDGSFISL